MKPNSIVVGDTLEILRAVPDSTFDVGVTSPPYNKGEKHQGWLVENVLYDEACDQKSEDEYQAEQIVVLDELYRATKPGGSFFYNHKIRWERGKLLHPYQWLAQTKWTLRQEIVWHRHIAGNMRGWRFWQVEERIYWLQKPRFSGDLIGEELASRHALLTSIWDMRPDSDPRHPNPFPLELPTRCIYSILDGKQGLVVDPYAGIGTTLLAAKLLDCSYYGIDISANYAALAEERVANPSGNDRASVLAELALHRVVQTFSDRKAAGTSKNRVKAKQAAAKELSGLTGF